MLSRISSDNTSSVQGDETVLVLDRTSDDEG